MSGIFCEAHTAGMTVLEYYERVVMQARARALVERLNADDPNRPFGKLDYSQYHPRPTELKADGRVRFELPEDAA